MTIALLQWGRTISVRSALGSACVISQESLQKYYGGMVFTISTFALLQSVSNTAAQCIKYKSDHITLLLRTFQQLPVSLSQRPCYNLPVLWFDASPLPLWLHFPPPPQFMLLHKLPWALCYFLKTLILGSLQFLSLLFGMVASKIATWVFTLWILRT